MRSNRGFTMVEILVVMALISVLMGFGIGMYQSLSALGKATQARNTLLETIQRVKASSRSWPAALVVDPAEGLVYGLEFRTVASCSFEPPIGDKEPGTRVTGLSYKHGTIHGDGVLNPFPFGHTGGGLGFLTGGQVDFGNYSDFDLVEGVQISIWIYPVENGSMDLLTKGDSYGVGLQRGPGGPLVEGFLSLSEKDDLTGKAASSKTRYLVTDHPLILNRWNRVVMNYDRTVVSIAIDSWGRGAVERLREKEDRRIAPDEQASLVVGGPEFMVGRVDDMHLAGILSGDPRSLPEDVTIKPKGVPGEQKPWQIRFRDGKLDPEYHRGPETIVLIYEEIENPITIGMLGNILMK